MISAVHTDERVSEISSVAHKLRDLYDPEGLFLLVDIHEEDGHYIQLIARSTTDTIHVGQIAERFGGGGHPRAAAAHIEDQTLAEVHDQLLSVLNESVRPAATVRQIMSFTVRTLTPDQTIQEAAKMVTRYGHEGYPIVKDNRVYGLITRREIDKAMHHRLGGASVEQFMHQGEIFVSPDDTVEAVQKIMLREEIGQVPVLENGKVIGIVTRTDLINLWSADIEAPDQHPNLAERLAVNLPQPLLNLLQEAGHEATRIGCSLYIVGGFVRDLLLEIPSLDVDLVVEGDAIALAEAMQARHGGRVHSHRRFGTANWMIEGAIAGIERLDFVTARTEFYRHPTALPEVEQSSIRQDLHRRDFTINTLAICLDSDRFGDLLDFYGGYHDLQARRIRVLHSLSFIEDPTRILRAIRLEQRLDFQIGRRTLEHLKNAIDLIPRVTADRVFSEIEYTLKEVRPEKALLRLNELGVLAAIQPQLYADAWFADHCEQLRTELPASPWA
jgi:tRNA nucleotidyltransferase (CCA-adding enzyme)